MDKGKLAKQLLKIVAALDEDGVLLHNFTRVHQELEQEKEQQITGGIWNCIKIHATKSGMEGLDECWRIYTTEIYDRLEITKSIGKVWRYGDAKAMAGTRGLIEAAKALIDAIDIDDLDCETIAVGGNAVRRLRTSLYRAGILREDGTWNL